MKIQQELIDKISSGQCVAFFGAGASIEAQAPTASQLAQELNELYLNGKYVNESLSKISSYIETKIGYGRVSVVSYIINRLSKLEPSNGHLLVPKFNWASLYTTNYDTLVEAAYSNCGIDYRSIITNTDLSISSNERESLKLIHKPHGCITRPESLIVSEDDYYKSSENRTAIFRQLEIYKYRNTFLFIGYSFSDFDLSKIWFDIMREAGEFAQWSYALWPDCTEEQKSLWQTRNVVLIDAKFSEFMRELDKSIFKQKISNKSTRDDELNSSSEIVKALLLCIEMKDIYRKKHSILTSNIACEISKELGLDKKIQNDIEIAALLHDIGIIKIPDNILFKTSPLTLPEFELIKQHTTFGEEIIASIPTLKHLAGIIRHHHESFDGNGYPDGIRQDEIPIEVKVITLADIFASMCINRPYRRSMNIIEAVQEINQGNYFDPKVVNAFNIVYENGPITKIVNSFN